MVTIASIVTMIFALYAWGLVRLRRARAAIRAELARSGYDIVEMQHRIVRLGPLFWTTTRSQVVYRIVVRDAAGRRRAGWTRWGRTWLMKPDTLELRWDD